ncbi:MAG: very short patch repair endonuclease [Idiomarina sp.]|nr:very short patch repair endonuclease [Idiomarina sp.]
MRAIKSKNTSIEVQVRKMLWHAGYRYRLNVKDLPGTPDIYLPKYNAAIQINGCLWHGHDCPQFVLPKTRTEFWKEKILSNVERDLRNITESRQRNLRVLLIWECAIRGGGRLEPDYLLKLISRWLPTDDGLSIIDKQGLYSSPSGNLKKLINKDLKLG